LEDDTGSVVESVRIPCFAGWRRKSHDFRHIAARLVAHCKRKCSKAASRREVRRVKRHYPDERFKHATVSRDGP
jgi:hypothetical protein